MPSFDVCDLFLLSFVFVFVCFFCKYQGLIIWKHPSVGLKGYCLTSSPVKLTRDVGGEMSHVIFNFHLGKDQSVLYQKKGVGHLFFINRPIHSPTHIGQSLISTSRFIQPAPGITVSLATQVTAYVFYYYSQRFLMVYRCFPQSHMKN